MNAKSLFSFLLIAATALIVNTKLAHADDTHFMNGTWEIVDPINSWVQNKPLGPIMGSGNENIKGIYFFTIFKVERYDEDNLSVKFCARLNEADASRVGYEIYCPRPVVYFNIHGAGSKYPNVYGLKDWNNYTYYLHARTSDHSLLFNNAFFGGNFWSKLKRIGN